MEYEVVGMTMGYDPGYSRLLGALIECKNEVVLLVLERYPEIGLGIASWRGLKVMGLVSSRLSESFQQIPGVLRPGEPLVPSRPASVSNGLDAFRAY